jgi:hypothetical protein
MDHNRRKDNIQHRLDAVTLIQFEASEIPAANFSFTSRGRLTWLGRPAFRNLYPEICTSHQFIENLREGLWSCLLLCAGSDRSRGSSGAYSMILLVIRWEADRLTAERTDTVEVFFDREEDTVLEKEMWEWRRVRLV